MFRHCEGFNTYEETLATLSSRSSQLQAMTGYKVNIYSNWDYQVHLLFVELALNKEQTEVEVISSEGTSVETLPSIEGSVGNFYINITDHKNKEFNYFVTDNNEINDRLWQLFKILSSKEQPEEYEG